jgi:hypothetical protein
VSYLYDITITRISVPALYSIQLRKRIDHKRSEGVVIELRVGPRDFNAFGIV